MIPLLSTTVFLRVKHHLSSGVNVLSRCFWGVLKSRLRVTIIRRNATKVAFSPIPITVPVVCLPHCGQTVQDRHIGCMEVECECGGEISIGGIFDPLGPH